MNQKFINRFDVEKHLKVPKYWDAPQFAYQGVKSLFYEGAPYQGHDTSCFAWLGMPEGASADHPVPAIVIVHGGGGTALANWVCHWNSLGYAAISMDTCGNLPAWSCCPGWSPQWPRNPNGGAPGWGGIDQCDRPLTDQWPYQATAAVLRATALLRSLPEVRKDAIGIVGVSWGGYLTLVANSVAPKGTYRFAIPIYASAGFMSLPSSIYEYKKQWTHEQVDAWCNLWDPKQALENIQTPTLFLTDAEDLAFALPTWAATTEAISGDAHRSMRIFYVHSHEQCMISKTQAYFADAIINGTPLPVWGTPERHDHQVTCNFSYPGHHLQKAILCQTRATGHWGDRVWQQKPALLQENLLKAELLYKANTAFFQVTDDYGCVWSSPVLQNMKEDNDFWPNI